MAPIPFFYMYTIVIYHNTIVATQERNALQFMAATVTLERYGALFGSRDRNLLDAQDCLSCV